MTASADPWAQDDGYWAQPDAPPPPAARQAAQGLPLYPGFVADDWRELAGPMTGRDERLAAELAYDAYEDHDAKHTRHTHPWCTSCEARSSADHLGDPELGVIERRVQQRAARYLLMKGRPPQDSYDPAAEAKWDGEYLTADQLQTLPDPEPMIDGVLMRHSYALLTGRDGSYKSFLALDWALCIATGRPWQGRPTTQGPVLYIAGEGAHGLAKRVAAWSYAWATPIDPAMFVVRRSALNLHRGGAELEDLIQRIHAGRHALVVIDTLRRVSGGADGNSSDMGAVIDNIERIKRATDNGTALAIAHTDKGDNDARGYSGIEDDADIVWHAKRDQDLLHLANRKMKDVPDGAELHLQTSPALDSLVLANADRRHAAHQADDISDRAQELLHDLRTVFNHTGATKAEYFEHNPAYPRSTYYSARKQLLDSGLARQEKSRLWPTQSNPVQGDQPLEN